MTPQNCIVPLGGSEDGDCWRACIASILNLPAADVPNFGDGAVVHDEAVARAREWLAPRGLTLFRTYCSAGWSLEKVLEVFSGRENAGVPFILSGRSGSDPTDNHAVVAMDGCIAHDPSGVGLSGPCTDDKGEDAWWWIDVICVGKGA